MFLLNSRLSRFHDTQIAAFKLTIKAHHLPKVRSYFAEFLRYHYLKRLSIQCQPTCVGFRYGLIPSCFLRQKPFVLKIVDQQKFLKTRDAGYAHRFKQLLFIHKLAKRPYQLLKDYLHITKPGGTATLFYTVLFVTYISIG